MSPTLETKRLTLRAPKLSDAPSMQRYFSNWKIIKNLGLQVPWPYPLNGSEHFLREIAIPHIERGEIDMWGITVKGSDEVIGIIEFRPKLKDPNGDRGFWLAEPFWGQGYMSEATAAVNDYIFEVLKMESFTEHNAADNEASRRLKIQWNAEYVGQEPASYRSGCAATDIWRVTREGWAAARAAHP